MGNQKTRTDGSMMDDRRRPCFFFFLSLQLIATVDANQLDIKDQSGASGDRRAHGAGAIGQLGRDRQLALLSNAHIEQSLIPALDYLADSKGKVQGTVTIPG